MSWYPDLNLLIYKNKIETGSTSDYNIWRDRKNVFVKSPKTDISKEFLFLDGFIPSSLPYENDSIEELTLKKINKETQFLLNKFNGRVVLYNYYDLICMFRIWDKNE